MGVPVLQQSAATRLPKLEPPKQATTTPGLNTSLQISTNVTLSHNRAVFNGGVLYVWGTLDKGLQLQVRRHGSWRPGRAPHLYA